jgi:hypothetical protein
MQRISAVLFGVLSMAMRTTIKQLERISNPTVPTSATTKLLGLASGVNVITTEIFTGTAPSDTSNPQVINPARLAKLEGKPIEKSQWAGSTANQARAPPPQNFLPLELVTNPTVPTNAAAYYLNRRPQTLRIWAAYETAGPIRPIRINGRLAWPVSELRRVLGVM